MEQVRSPGPIIDRSGLSTPAPARRCSTRADCRCRLRRTAGTRAAGRRPPFGKRVAIDRSGQPAPALTPALPGRDRGRPPRLQGRCSTEPDSRSRFPGNGCSTQVDLPGFSACVAGCSPGAPVSQPLLPQRSAATGRQGGKSFIRFVSARSGPSGSFPRIWVIAAIRQGITGKNTIMFQKIVRDRRGACRQECCSD